MAKSMSQVRAVFTELGYMSAAYGETIYTMNKERNSSQDVVICSKFDIVFVNRYITITDYAFDLFATPESLFFKEESKLDEVVSIIKGHDFSFCRCDNIDAYQFSSQVISEFQFKDNMKSNGFFEKSIDFEFWALLSGGVIEDIKYKGIDKKTVFPKFLTNIFGNARYDEIHFPFIGKMPKARYDQFYSMSIEVFKEFASLFFRKKYIKCPSKKVSTFDDFRAAVNFNTGEEVDTSVVARFLFYRHELTHSFVMKAANKTVAASDVKFGIFFPTAPAVIKKMSPDTLYVNEESKKITIHETFVTDSGNVMRLAGKKRSKYTLTASYFVGYEVEVFVNGLCLSNPSQSVIESKDDFDATDLINEIKAMESSLRAFPGFEEARRLLRDDMDEEEYEMREGAYKQFIDWIDAYAVKYPAAADLKEMRSKESKDILEEANMVTTKVDDDETLNMLRSISEDFNTKEYVERVADSIVKNVDNEEYCPELKRVFENTGLAIINYCTKYRSEIPADRPSSMHKKLFKFPIITLDRHRISETEIDKYTPVKVSKWGYKTAKHKSYMLNEVNWEFQEKNTGGDEGLMIYKSDVSFVDSAMDFMFGESSAEFRSRIEAMTVNFDNDFRRDFNYMCRFRLFEVTFLASSLVTNIACLVADASRGDKVVVTRSFSADGYLLHMLPCNGITQVLNAKYYLESTANIVKEEEVGVWFHSFNRMFDKNTLRTRVCSIGISDISQFESMFYVLVTFIKLMADVKKESHVGEVNIVEMINNKTIQVMAMVLVSHIKSTSNFLQDLRYTLMSTTALYADLINHLEESLSKPGRSLMDSYLKQATLKWVELTTQGRDELFSTIVSSGMKVEGIKIMVPDFFEEGKVEFGWLLSLVYSMNFAKKTLGSKYHKSIGIVEKMAEIEMSFIKNRNSNNCMNGNIGSVDEFIAKEDIKLEFDYEAYMAIGNLTHDHLTRSNFPFYKEAMKALKIPISKIATSKSSLFSLGISHMDVFDPPNRFLKGTALETTARIFRITENLTCFQNLSYSDTLVAMFLLFAKDQVGSNREIFQQSIMLRSCLLPVESFFQSMMPYFPEDTSSKRDHKEMYQMETMQKVHRSFTAEWIFEKLFGVTYSLNADMSKFSPSFLMDALCAFVINLKLPTLMEKTALTLLKAFSVKVCRLPLNLSNFDPEQFTTDKEAKKWIAENLHLDSKSMVFFSGMGQGMLFFLTCVLVLGKHLLETEVMAVIKSKLVGLVKEFQATLLCSDDITKLGFVIAGKGNSVFRTMRLILMTFNTCCRLAGLHPSWRKVDLHLMVAEYNSFFSQRMRPIVSYLKWLMPVFATRQMNYPELACKDILSACFELFKRGASLSLLKFILASARIQMIERLKLGSVTEEIMGTLNCKYEDLPIELGYIPMANTLTLLTSGPEYLIYKHISKEMDSFIAGVYSRNRRDVLDQDSVLEPLMKHRVFLYRQVNKQVERRKKLVKELSLDKSKAADLAEQTSLLNLDYGCMPSSILTVLHKAHQDVHDPDKDSLSVKALIMVMGIVNKKGGVEGLTHKEAEDLLGHEIMCYYKGSTGAERFTDMPMFAKMMVVKGMRTEYSSHLKLLSYNKRFLDLEEYLNTIKSRMIEVKSNIPYYMRTVHLSGMSVLEELDASTIIMSMFGSGCEVRRMDEVRADSFLSLKTFKAVELLKETLGMRGIVEPIDILNKVLVMFKGHNSPIEAFKEYVVKTKKKLSSMNFTTPLLKRDNCLDLRSTMAMLMLQRTDPGVLYALKESSDTRQDYMHIMSSLCTLVRDSDNVYAFLMEKMQDDGFRDLSDTSLSKTHPKELFLKVAWNIYSEKSLYRMELTRPYRCALWSDPKKRSCITDFINFAIIEDSRLLEQVRVMKISFFTQTSQIRYNSSLYRYALQLKRDKEREGYNVIFEGKKFDEEYGFITTKVQFVALRCKCQVNSLVKLLPYYFSLGYVSDFR